jgi:hypothetical protein
LADAARRLDDLAERLGRVSAAIGELQAEAADVVHRESPDEAGTDGSDREA